MKHLSRSARKRDFNIHAAVFALSTLGWSIGLLMHWWFVLGPGAAGVRRGH
jgi:hypothetical protein